MLSRQRGTVRRFRLADRIDEDGEEQHQRLGAWDDVISEVPRCPVMQTPVHQTVSNTATDAENVVYHIS